MSSLTDSIPGRRTGLILSSAMQLLLRLKGDQTRLIGEATNDVTRSGLRAEPGVSFGDDAGNKAWGNTLKPRFANELGSETQLNNRTFSPWGSCQIPFVGKYYASFAVQKCAKKRTKSESYQCVWENPLYLPNDRERIATTMRLFFSYPGLCGAPRRGLLRIHGPGV